MTAPPEDLPSAPPVDLDGLFRLDDRVAVVTGASSGLGERFARVLRAAGAEVVAAARRLDRLERLADETGALPVACDVAVDADLDRLVATALDRLGRIDVLVNNAGIAVTLPAEKEPVEDWRRVIDVNLNALFVLSQLVGRQMLERRSGSIVNVASMLGLVASAPIKQASYCASKGGVINLTRELAAQWGRKGVRVNAIAPGYFPTEMTELMMGDESSQSYVARTCPMGRMGEPHELDGILVYLASDASSYTNGQIIAVDGGWTAR